MAITLYGSKQAIIQIQSVTKTDTFSTTTTGWLDIPTLSVSITPSSASNKIFISLVSHKTIFTQFRQN